MRVLVFLLVLIGASAHAGNAGKGGGAGCENGKGSIITLFYCGAYHGPISKTAPPPPASVNDNDSETPPGLEELKAFVRDFPYFSPSVKDEIFKAIIPSDTRKYLTVPAVPLVAADFEIRAKKEFSKVTGIDVSKLQLYAVTNPKAVMRNYDGVIQVTYLLTDGFGRLGTNEQRMVALFHENLWVLNPDATLELVINAELSFEAMLAKPQSAVRKLDFVKNFNLLINHGRPTVIYPPSVLNLIMERDLELHALDGFLSDNQFTNVQLLGPLITECVNGTKAWNLCAARYENHVDGLRDRFPNSEFLAMVSEVEKLFFPFSEDTRYYSNETVIAHVLCAISGCSASTDDTQINIFNKDEFSKSPFHILWRATKKDQYGNVVPGHLNTDEFAFKISLDKDLKRGPLILTEPVVSGQEMWQRDIESGALTNLIDSHGQISLTTLVGIKGVNCLSGDVSSNAYYYQSDQGECFRILKDNLDALSKNYYRSLTIRYLAQAISPAKTRGWDYWISDFDFFHIESLSADKKSTAVGMYNWNKNTKIGLKNVVFSFNPETESLEYRKDDSLFAIPLIPIEGPR